MEEGADEFFERRKTRWKVCVLLQRIFFLKINFEKNYLLRKWTSRPYLNKLGQNFCVCVYRCPTTTL